MNDRLFIRTGATVAAAAMSVLAVGPAFAAEPVSKASSVALSLGIAGTAVDSGTFVAQHNGTIQTTSGNNAPAIGVVSGQNLITTGTLAQNASTSITDGNGVSSACSGIAGPGATLASVGTDANCLTGGSTLDIKAGNIDLGAISLTSGALAIPGISDLGSIPGLGPALDAISAGLRTLLTTIGDPAINLSLGAVTSSCNATPTSANGRSSVVDSTASVTLPVVGKINLVNLPVNPAPNTKVVTGLSSVVEAIQEALKTQLNTLATAQLGPLSAAIGTLVPALASGLNIIIDTLQTQLLDRLAPALAPLEQNVLDITLNKQTTGTGSISVTALDAQVLPVARTFINSSLIDLKVGQVTCGPNLRVTATPPGDTPGEPTDDRSITPVSADTPKAVTSGLDSFATNPSVLGMAALAGLTLAGTAAGVIGFRRSLTRP